MNQALRQAVCLICRPPHRPVSETANSGNQHVLRRTPVINQVCGARSLDCPTAVFADRFIVDARVTVCVSRFELLFRPGFRLPSDVSNFVCRDSLDLIGPDWPWRSDWQLSAIKSNFLLIKQVNYLSSRVSARCANSRNKRSQVCN